ncbi:DUF3014 domain-containing protein [Methylohalobius crimeensis]|uniref:DUF3014 domain-containing protein n=1 Tax=Methylohalobius crimeensis TaxID=244365 RepID=UPI0003B5F681|nr:DUF3014 domain-containing protein [Methylohalobius crimeensis]
MPDDLSKQKNDVSASPLRKLLWILAILILLAVAGVILWRSYQAQQASIMSEEEAPQTSPAETTGPIQPGVSEPVSPSEEAAREGPSEEFVPREDTTVELPPAPESQAESDPWLREQLPLANPYPLFMDWLNETSDLLRKWVVLVSEVAQGRVPRKLFPFWAPQTPFAVQETEEGYVIDPAGYHRYDELAQAVDGWDIDLAWRMYQHLKPLIDQVYAQIGRPDTKFDDVLLSAIEHLLQTPQPRGEIGLVKPAVMYKYADPKLEALSDAQKQLLRMGPVNATMIKHKLGLVRGKLLKNE